MDPRKAATITAPDLLAAFHEHAPHQGEQTTTELRLYVVLTRGDDVISASAHVLEELSEVLATVALHLKLKGNGAFMVTAGDAPELFNDAVSALEA